jgi:Na+/H+ antiporter NhaD/arsenite permease-like protein
MYTPPPVWSFLPFVLLLLAIALLPLIRATAHWWEHNRNKLLVSLVLAAMTLAYYGLAHPGLRAHHEAAPAAEAHPGTGTAEGATTGHENAASGDTLIHGLPAVLKVLDHAVVNDFVPFIILLFSLYTISGGIVLRGDIRARPATNCAFLATGAVLASFMGTTGASMLLIRPVLKTNSERRHVAHTVIFFILIVSNIGGCLTPLGDPPLYLGFLRGVPFWWTMRLVYEWLFLNVYLLAVYFVWDTLAYRRERPRDIIRDETQVQRLSLGGPANFFWLLCVIGVVATVDSSRELPLLGVRPPPFTREVLLLVLTALSWFTTRNNRAIREENRFNFTAIFEVACLFIGIFICMQAPVEYLQEEGATLGLKTAPAFFWATGSLSSFLDNAPTYVVFFKAAKALTDGLIASGAVSAVDPSVVLPLLEGGYILQSLLVGVSLGAVFMGANTYIGNGPNFMVKAIAEQAKVTMPSFFGYMLYSIGIVILPFTAVTFIFLR